MTSIKMHAYFSDIRSNKFQSTKLSVCLTTLFIFTYSEEQKVPSVHKY